MGIKGIKSLIKKHVPDAIKELKLNEISGKTVCIDSSILLYKYSFVYNADNFHILGFLHKIIELQDHNIKMIFVFDGKPPEAKREILNKRKEQNIKLKEQIETLKESVKSVTIFEEAFIDSDNEVEESEIKKAKEIHKKINALEKNVKKVTRQHSLDVMELLKSLGIPFLISETEAEKGCVFLQKNGYSDYILTEDTDCLTFGGTNVIFNKKNDYFVCYLDKVLEGLELTHEAFVDLCILCGCDYTCTIPKVGPVTALNAIKKYNSIEKYIENTKVSLPEAFNYQIARELFKVDKENELTENVKNKENLTKVLIRWNLNSFISKFHFYEILTFNLI
jgi:flap endonuclease-1